jgi:hypothetical protein
MIPKQTHGLQVTDIGDDGASRTMGLAKYVDNSYYLKIVTKSDGFDDMVTQVLFTEFGIHMLRAFLNSALDEIDNHPVLTNE